MTSKIQHLALNTLPSTVPNAGSIVYLSNGSQYVTTSNGTYIKFSDLVFTDTLPEFGTVEKLYIHTENGKSKLKVWNNLDFESLSGDTYNDTELRGLLTTLQGEVDVLKGSINTINGEVSTLNGKVTALETELDSLDLSNIEADILTNTNDIVTINTKVADLETDITTLESDMDNVDVKILALETKTSNINKTISSPTQPSDLNVGDYWHEITN